jgi:dihydropteroate synthase
MKTTIRIGSELMDLSTPKVMGILNITPDSFFEQSRISDAEGLIHKASDMLHNGADILDVGGQSTRPGANDIGLEEELKRVIPTIKLLRDAFPEAVLSVDTYRSEVARQAANAGANLINDISGGRLDANMFRTVSDLQLPYVLMHIQGNPKTMQTNPSYKDVVNDVFAELKSGIDSLLSMGVKDLILDPGFGFGKSLEQNYEMLLRLEEFKALNFPILVGLSRKSMVNKVLNIPATEALNGTTFLHALALERGASILRVHDVKEAVECRQLMEYINDIRPNNV